MSGCTDSKAVALVLGASTPTGVGATCARRLRRQGFDLVVSGRRLAPLQALAGELDGLALACDISDESSVAGLAAAIEQQRGRLSVAVNAAGQAVMGSIHRTSAAQLEQALAVHLKGPFYFFKHLAAIMGSPAAMITLSTLTASRPIEGHAAYAAAKAGTDQLVQTAALELAPRGVRVNAITPGFMLTPMTEGLATDAAVEAFIRETPLGRLTTPADIADGVAWLAGDAFITGQNLQINGGATLRRMPNRDELRGSC